jgi:hypothetical protein
LTLGKDRDERNKIKDDICSASCRTRKKPLNKAVFWCSKIWPQNFHAFGRKYLRHDFAGGEKSAEKYFAYGSISFLHDFAGGEIA